MIVCGDSFQNCQSIKRVFEKLHRLSDISSIGYYRKYPQKNSNR